MAGIHFRRPSPAMAVALIALFVALGGSGYAAVKINGKDIRNRSIPGKKLARNSLGRDEIKETQLALQPLGMWATINAPGNFVLAQSGGVSVAAHPGPGRYFVRFPAAVKGTAVLASPAANVGDSPRGSSDVKAAACGGGPNQVDAYACDAPGTNTARHAFVATFNNGVPADVAFVIAVMP